MNPRVRRSTAAQFALGVLLVAGPAATGQVDTRPLADQPFHGLLVRDDASTGGLLVGWILPGPFNGRGFTSDVVNRGDLILEVNGSRMDREAFESFMGSAAPGESVRLLVRHTGGDTSTAVPTAGASSSDREYEFTLARRADWTGPIAHQPEDASAFDPDAVVPMRRNEGILERFVLKNVEEQGLVEPVDQLRAYFIETAEKNVGAHMLSRVRYGFHRPTRLAELQGAVTDPLFGVPRQPFVLLTETAVNLDCAEPLPGNPVDWSEPQSAVKSIAQAVSASRAQVDRAFKNVDSKMRTSLPATLADITETVAQDVYIHGHPEAKRLIDGLRASLSVDFGALIQAAADLSGLMEPVAPAGELGGGIVVPAPLRAKVTGDILAFDVVGDEWVVYGGAGPNSYDMTSIAAVIDAGGEDEYRYPSESRPDVQAIVDLAGNDHYIGAGRGPASAVMGVSLVVDQSGNDRYEGQSRSCGVGVMGIGVLLDRDGADTYVGTRWSVGAAFYGLGAIIDCGREGDTYLAELMSQGIGGPRGFGVIVDEHGRDLYRVNGPAPSAYGTPAVYVGFSQGVGFGVRLYDTGGIGVISDLGGDDRYEGGEFCQGGGYYWGLGILHDRLGRDLYYGNRYGQAWAAHQALGILADDAGDDTYWSMTAASQSGSWDISATLLVDKGGNDSYQADGLAQGGASQQAIAWFVDNSGTDRYVAPPGATRGQSGGNEYHFAESGCSSWSVFVDSGGTEDFYSEGRANGETKTTGSANEENPQNSQLHGLFIDTVEPVLLFFEW